MSKLEFKPKDRQSIDFAEQERIASEERGKIVHFEDEEYKFLKQVKEILLFEHKLTDVADSISCEELDINNQEILCYEIVSGVIGLEADLQIQVGSAAGMSTAYHTFGLAHGTIDYGDNLSFWKAGYFCLGRFYGKGEIAVVDGDASMLCKGVASSGSKGGFRSFGGNCNLSGENITKIKFSLSHGKFPVGTFVKIYKKARG